MTLLLIRVLVAPGLVAAGSLAQRRWGMAVGGRLIGLPLTSIPLLALMAYSNGDRFAAQATTSTLAGGIAASLWCVAYVVAARRHNAVVAGLGATAVFGLAALALDHLALGTVAAAVASAICLVGALAVWPATGHHEHAPTHSRAELPVRMVVAAGFTFAISSIAGSLGARPAGLVSSLPVLTIVLAVAAHRQGGPAATSGFLRGVMAGSWSLVASLTVLAVMLPALGAEMAFPAAVLAAVAAQWIAAQAGRPLPGPAIAALSRPPRRSATTALQPMAASTTE